MVCLSVSSFSQRTARPERVEGRASATYLVISADLSVWFDGLTMSGYRLTMMGYRLTMMGYRKYIVGCLCLWRVGAGFETIPYDPDVNESS